MKSKFNLQAYLQSLGIRPEIKGQGRFAYVPCPDCDNSNPHLYINMETNYFGCWKSEDHRGGPVQLVMHLEKVSYREAVEAVKRFSKEVFLDIDAELEQILNPKAEKMEEKKSFPSIFLPEGLVPADTSRGAMKYLRSRGFTVQTVRDWDLKYAENVKYRNLKFKRRVIAPIYLNGEIVAFQGRDITGRQGVPYLSSPLDNGFAINQVVYNLDRAETSLLVLTEGLFDCWSVGKEHGGCIFGKRLYPEQFKAIMNAKIEHVVVALDDDAREEAFRIGMDLSSIVSKVSVLELPQGEDPCSLGRDGFWELLRKKL